MFKVKGQRSTCIINHKTGFRGRHGSLIHFRIAVSKKWKWPNMIADNNFNTRKPSFSRQLLTFCRQTLNIKPKEKDHMENKNKNFYLIN